MCIYIYTIHTHTHCLSLSHISWTYISINYYNIYSIYEACTEALRCNWRARLPWRGRRVWVHRLLLLLLLLLLSFRVLSLGFRVSSRSSGSKSSSNTMLLRRLLLLLMLWPIYRKAPGNSGINARRDLKFSCRQFRSLPFPTKSVHKTSNASGVGCATVLMSVTFYVAFTISKKAHENSMNYMHREKLQLARWQRGQ